MLLPDDALSEGDLRTLLPAVWQTAQDEPLDDVVLASSNFRLLSDTFSSSSSAGCCVLSSRGGGGDFFLFCFFALVGSQSAGNNSSSPMLAKQGSARARSYSFLAHVSQGSFFGNRLKKDLFLELGETPQYVALWCV
jgi:hypothetical protein